MLDGVAEMRIEAADLTRDLVGFHGGLDRSTTCVAEDDQGFDTENGDAVLKAADDLRRDNVAGDAADEDVADGLVEDQLDGNA